MFLTGNLRIHSVQWDNPVDRSNLPTDLQCKVLYYRLYSGKYIIWSVKCAELYIIKYNVICTIF